MMHMINIPLPFKGINGRNHSYFEIFKRKDHFLEVYDCLVINIPINPLKHRVGICVINNANDLEVGICSQDFDVHGYLGKSTNW